MVNELIKDAKERMEKTLQATQIELGKIRTGRANLSMLDSVKVNYYGSLVPLKQAANLGIPEPRLIIIQPWDRSMVGEIEKAILKADIGVTPNNDGTVIRLPIPSLTEERRKNLAKVAQQVGEDGKIAIRNIRRDVLDQLKKAQKDSEISEDEEYNGGIDTQELTDKFIEKIEESVKAKTREILED
ncbi:MAG TPA: ribosome recycling factor [bacterium]|nr:ribosome recycling factor [bacterium]